MVSSLLLSLAPNLLNMVPHQHLLSRSWRSSIPQSLSPSRQRWGVTNGWDLKRGGTHDSAPIAPELHFLESEIIIFKIRNNPSHYENYPAQ